MRIPLALAQIGYAIQVAFDLLNTNMHIVPMNIIPMKYMKQKKLNLSHLKCSSCDITVTYGIRSGRIK